MSNPRAKAERAKAKDIRQGKIEQRGALPKNRKQKADKPYSVWTYWMLSSIQEPFERYKCATLEQALYLIEKEKRSFGTRSDRPYWITHNGKVVDGI